MGNKVERRNQLRKKFSSLMTYNLKEGHKKGSGVKPKITVGAFGCQRSDDKKTFLKKKKAEKKKG
jgi:hypothetical protein